MNYTGETTPPASLPKGIRHYYTYLTPIFHLSFTYLTPIFHLSFTYLSPIFHLSFTYLSPIFHLSFTYLSPIFHLSFTYLYRVNECCKELIKTSESNPKKTIQIFDITFMLLCDITQRYKYKVGSTH